MLCNTCHTVLYDYGHVGKQHTFHMGDFHCRHHPHQEVLRVIEPEEPPLEHLPAITPLDAYQAHAAESVVPLFYSLGDTHATIMIHTISQQHLERFLALPQEEQAQFYAQLRQLIIDTVR